jgi:hypothetical protein
MYKGILTFAILIVWISSLGQSNEVWDSIKAATSPAVAPDLQEYYEIPYRQALSAYGWEDGIHISRDGLNLYALYYPGDLLGWTMFFLDNINELPICDLLGNTDYLRDYANTYGMDMVSNVVGCEDFVNIDILYANRENIDTPFSDWQLSGIARAGNPEGGACTLQSESDSEYLDIFLFTATSDIWMIRNTGINPSGIENAERLPSPINPLESEFSADNPHIEKFNDGSLLLVYEKYTNSNSRDFVYSFSYDNAYSWTNPVAMETISPSLGHIEHPHLYKDSTGTWYMYFSIDCEIYRAVQSIADDWDSWENIELVISKGNSPCIGEPSITENGDISFAVVYQNNANNDNTDTFDIDPWFLPIKSSLTDIERKSSNINISVYPNPAKDIFYISSQEMIVCELYDSSGRVVKTFYSNRCSLEDIPKGLYYVKIYCCNDVYIRKLVKN